MKKSRYNILSNFGDKHLLYNTVTGATVLLNDEYYSQYVSNDKKADIARFYEKQPNSFTYDCTYIVLQFQMPLLL